MRISPSRVSTAAALFLSLSCCGHPSPATQPAAIASPTRHWTQGEKLQKVMDRIAGLSQAFPKGLPEDAESPAGVEARRSLAEAAAVAGALADAAGEIPKAVARKPMSDADRLGFQRRSEPPP